MNQNPGALLFDLATGYWRSATLSAAVEMGVFEALARSASSVGELAEKLAASSPHLEPFIARRAVVFVFLARETSSSQKPSKTKPRNTK